LILSAPQIQTLLWTYSCSCSYWWFVLWSFSDI